MASYLQLAWSFINFLYEDEEEEAPVDEKWVLHAVHTTQPLNTSTGYFGRILWNLSFTLLAIATAYAIMCLCKNDTYRRYIRDFRAPPFITDAITSVRNIYLQLTYHSTPSTTEETSHPQNE